MRKLADKVLASNLIEILILDGSSNELDIIDSPTMH